LGELAEILDDVSVEMIPLRYGWGCRTFQTASHIYVIHIRCLNTLNSCGWAYGCTLTPLSPQSFPQIWESWLKSVLPKEQELIPEYWVNIFRACVRPCMLPPTDKRRRCILCKTTHLCYILMVFCSYLEYNTVTPSISYAPFRSLVIPTYDFHPNRK